jgi:acetylornithine deacetylase/succinyl-diaminopimelate desuccinylase-like protein
MSEHTCVEKEKARFGVWRRDAGDALVQCACRAATREKTIAFGGVSDAWWNDKAQGLIIGPGLPELSHAANEYLEETELWRGYEIYRKTAELYLNG